MVETGEYGDVGTRATGPVVMEYALAELTLDMASIVARQHETGFKSGRNFNHTLYIKMYLYIYLAEKSLPKGCVKGVWFKLRFTPRFDFEIA